MHGYERMVMLQSLDQHWREHLAALDHLRQGIHLRGYAQKNPKQEYKREAFELFATMLEAIKHDVTQTLMTVQIRSEEDVEAVEAPHVPENVQYHHADYEEALASSEQQQRIKSHLCAVAKKLDAMIRAHAVQARNISSAMAS